MNRRSQRCQTLESMSVLGLLHQPCHYLLDGRAGYTKWHCLVSYAGLRGNEVLGYVTQKPDRSVEICQVFHWEQRYQSSIRQRIPDRHSKFKRRNLLSFFHPFCHFYLWIFCPEHLEQFIIFKFGNLTKWLINRSDECNDG